jgi:hypothetical protein
MLAQQLVPGQLLPQLTSSPGCVQPATANHALHHSYPFVPTFCTTIARTKSPRKPHASCVTICFVWEGPPEVWEASCRSQNSACSKISLFLLHQVLKIKCNQRLSSLVPKTSVLNSVLNTLAFKSFAKAYAGKVACKLYLWSSQDGRIVQHVHARRHPSVLECGRN